MTPLQNPMRRTLRKVEDLSHRAALALEAGSLATFEWNIITDSYIADAALRALLSLSSGEVTGAMIFDRVHPEDIRRLRRVLSRTLDHKGVDYDTSFRILRGDTVVWIGARGRVVERDPSGKALRMIGVHWDMTQAKQSEARQKELTREMDHRINNSYALMQALIDMGEMEFDRPDAFAAMLQTQIHALSDAHQLASDVLLHEQTRATGLPLDDLLGRALRQVPVTQRQFSIAPGLSVRMQDVAALAMVLHQLRVGAVRSAPVMLRATPAHAGWSELTWQSGAPIVRMAPPDFIISLCVEQLGGRLLHHAQSSAGQVLSFTFPVLDCGTGWTDGFCVADTPDSSARGSYA